MIKRKIHTGIAKVMILGIIILFSNVGTGQESLNYYLPDIEYDPSIPTFSSSLGFQAGEWHVSHDQLINYTKVLCDSSPKCQMVEYARSYEKRPLVYLVISSEDNLQNLDSLRKQHNLLTDSERSVHLNTEDLPLVLYQGYSIHGDESSGSQAAMLMAYYLIAGQSDKLKSLLDETIILLDPCMNPDGFQRFSTWVNMHRSHVPVTDPQSREFNEVWPDGRTNHYWFDLNRDWLFNIHPESRGRIETFHHWKPDILTDHHEMGSDRTFFFQPGIPSRTNPNTPLINQEITEEIAGYHAAFLDSIGSMYFTKESYDDFYYGKGSTYPDINGCIGILFEQATSEGYLRETKNGLLSFPFTIRNQVVTSLSTLEAAMKFKNRVLEYKRDYFSNKTRPSLKGYYIFEAADSYVRDYFLSLLDRHDINVYRHNPAVLEEFDHYSAENSFVVPLAQKQSGLVKTIFETVTEFRDNSFYDVSTWTMPLALNIPYGRSENELDISKLKLYTPEQKEKDLALSLPVESVALAIDWSAYLSPAVLYQLLENGIRVRILPEKSRFNSGELIIELSPGTLIIALENQELGRTEILDKVQELTSKYGVSFTGVDSFLPLEGEEIGSPSMDPVEKRDIALFVGEGINRYVAGESWFQLDQRYEIPVSLLDIGDLDRIDLSRYEVIIMPDGKYDSMDNSADKIGKWVQEGGTLIAMQGAITFLNASNIIDMPAKHDDRPQVLIENYEDVGVQTADHLIGGAILNADIDHTHPLFYGYNSDSLAVFRRGTTNYELTENPGATPMVYGSAPLISGYVSSHNLDLIKGSAALSCFARGRGRIIAFVDNPNFRGYWLGGSRLFANAIFFSNLISRQATE